MIAYRIGLDLFSAFFRIGAFTFGGGYAMLPLIEAEVENHQWMTISQLIDFVAVSESTPGPLAVNVSTYVGTELAGILGALCATLGVILPSFLIILIVAKGFERFQNSKTVKGCMAGLKPAVIGLIGSAVISVGHTVFFPAGFSAAALTTSAFLTSLVIFVLALVLALRKLHPIVIIALSAVLGICAGYLGLL